jgi:pilus assembly protein FimV
MSRGQNPLVLMMALSLPGAAHALGLGEIHVNSALNEPLAADIEILGATAEELSSLTASVANKDTFQRFGAERPAFLASATFKVSQDARGRPVLVIRSKHSFTEPVVNLLVDLRWHNGEVIRQYSLLLDPTGFPAAPQVAAAVRSPMVPPAMPTASAAIPVTAAPVGAADPTGAADRTPSAASPAAAPDAQTSPAVSAARNTTHMKIGAKATLRGVAWRVGARSDSDLKKTMLAVFRANPHAFEGNINRLRLGAVLTIPSAAEISAISNADAGREIDAQMTAWRASPQKMRSAAVPAQGAQTAAGTPAMTASGASMPAVGAPRMTERTGGDAAEEATLNLRVQSLEQDLHAVQSQLKREHDTLLTVQSQVTYAENAANSSDQAPPAPRRWPLTWIAGSALVAGALGLMLFGRRPRKPKVGSSPTVAPFTADDMAKSPAKPARAEPAPREMPRPVWQDLNELSASRDFARDDRQPEIPDAAPTADTAATDAFQPEFTISEEDLRASYEDTVDLTETGILPADFSAASGETVNLAAATVNLNAEEMQAVASAAADEGATVQISPSALHVDSTKLDYNLLDLDQTAQHVHMPSVLHERAVFKERRTNLVDVLKMAVEREPDRSDLRMKLLETYYTAAAANRKEFLELVQKVAPHRDQLGEGEWDKIAYMGEQIASDSALFSAAAQKVHADSLPDDDELANCA